MSQTEEDYGTTIVYDSDGFPSVECQITIFLLYSQPRSFQITYEEKLLLDYRYMNANGIIPRFEFGFGLSYTTFAYSGLFISTSSDPSKAATVSFTIANTGSVDGTEIPQLYLTYPPRAGEPEKVLRGFEEVDIAHGQSVTVRMTLSQRDLRLALFWV